MAFQHSENPSLLGPRQSPGDAAFQRLQKREALRTKGKPAVIGLVPETTAETSGTLAAVSPVKMPVAETGAAIAIQPEAEPAAEMNTEIVSEPVKAKGGAIVLEPATGPDTDDIVALAAEATGVSSVIAAPAPAVTDPTARIIAVAVALGIEATPDAPLRASPPRNARAEAPARAAEATAEKLEAALLDQLKTLEETLQTPARMPRAEPLRLSQVAAEEPEPIGPPRRSTFAPDPVRQRTYVDLRNPAPVPEKAASDDPPWRKYLAEPRRQGSRHAVSIHTEARRAEVRPAPALVAASYDTADEARERARGIRAMSAGALLGLGIGLGLLVLVRPFAEPVVSSITAPLPTASPRVIAAADVAAQPAHTAPTGVRDTAVEALATLLDKPEVTRAGAGQPAVITEPGVTPPKPVAAEATAHPPPAAPAAEPPIVIRPPPGQARRVARVPDFDAAETGPLAYVPAIPSYDPVRQSLLEEETPAVPDESVASDEVASAAADEAPVGRDIGRGRATIKTFVNMRAKPDNRAPVVAILADGLSVKVLSCDYWCEVEAGGKRGFVFKSFLMR